MYLLLSPYHITYINDYGNIFMLKSLTGTSPRQLDISQVLAYSAIVAPSFIRSLLRNNYQLSSVVKTAQMYDGPSVQIGLYQSA